VFGIGIEVIFWGQQFYLNNELKEKTPIQKKSGWLLAMFFFDFFG